MSYRSILKASGKAIAWFAGIALAIVACWYVANRVLDEPPLADRALYESTPPFHVPESENAAIGILGLSAPSGTDFQKFGAELLASFYAGEQYEVIKGKLVAPGTLTPTAAASAQVDCWLNQQTESQPGCRPLSEAKAIIQQNQEALDRLKALYRVGSYSGEPVPINPAYLVLLKLGIAEIRLAINEGRYEEAFSSWRTQMEFVRRNLRASDLWVGKALHVLAAGWIQPVIEELLHADPSLAARHQTALLAVLSPQEIQVLNSSEVIHREYMWIHDALEPGKDQRVRNGDDWLINGFTQRNRLLNRYFTFCQEFDQLMRLPRDKAKAEERHLREKYRQQYDYDFLIDPIGSVFVRALIASQMKAVELITHASIQEAYRRLSSLSVRLLAEDISDVAIPSYLANAGTSLFDPFTGKPMQWDPTNRRIFAPGSPSAYLPIEMKLPERSNGRSPSALGR